MVWYFTPRLSTRMLQEVAADVWLLRLLPHPQPNAINEDAWSLTCALALHSMERGHAYLYAQRRLADAVTRASHKAVGWLSYLLSDVASSGSIPKPWKGPPQPALFPLHHDPHFPPRGTLQLKCLQPSRSSQLTFNQPLFGLGCLTDLPPSSTTDGHFCVSPSVLPTVTLLSWLL